MCHINADFYEIADANGNIIGRRYLDISLQPTNSLNHLTFLLLNPGSCERLDNTKIGLQEASPDPTIHRIISLLKESKKYAGCRILNLSDVIEPVSKKFFKHQNSYKSRPHFEHSIFNPARKGELKKLIRKDTKILIAWGKQIDKTNIAQNALKALKSLNVDIINEHAIHYHPLVRLKNVRWRYEILKLL
jgi:hypothetical protein